MQGSTPWYATMKYLLLILLFSSGFSLQKEDKYTCDFIEINTVIDKDDKEQYTQAIFWVWCPEYKRYNVLGWTITSNKKYYLYKRDKYYEFRAPSDDNKPFVFYSKFIKYSRTIEDLERENIKIFPSEHRGGLTKKIK
jgi:hypothetical protein